MRMGRAGGLLVDGTAEEHLRIGALEDAGDAGATLELLLDDRPDGLMSSLGILDLLLPELGEPLPDVKARTGFPSGIGWLGGAYPIRRYARCGRRQLHLPALPAPAYCYQNGVRMT